MTLKRYSITLRHRPNRIVVDVSKDGEWVDYKDALAEIERLRGFLIEIEGPGTMDEKTFFARQALETKRVTVHGPQCPCSRCEAQRAVHTL